MRVGLERGMNVTIDPMDGWDYRAVMGEPVVQLRSSCNIVGAEDIWLSPPPPEPDDKGVAGWPTPRFRVSRVVHYRVASPVNCSCKTRRH